MKRAIIGLFAVGGLGLVAYGLYSYFQTQAKLLKDFQWKIIKFDLKNISLQLV